MSHDGVHTDERADRFCRINLIAFDTERPAGTFSNG
jgi:hypothetical protein